MLKQLTVYFHLWFLNLILFLLHQTNTSSMYYLSWISLRLHVPQRASSALIYPSESFSACRRTSVEVKWCWSCSSVLSLSQVSLKCRAPEVSQCVFQSYEAMLKNWETPPPPGRRPGRCPSPTPGASSRSPSPDPRTILHLHSVREPLPAVSGLEAALCMSFSSLIRMVNDDFCPIFDHMAVCFIPPETADISGSLSVLSLFVFVGTQLSVSGHLCLGKRSRWSPSRWAGAPLVPAGPRPAATFILLETDSRVTCIPVTASSAWGSLIIS